MAAGSLLAGCADAGTTPTRDFANGIDLNIAALNLVGVGDVVWDLQVTNGVATPQTVWQQRITSSQYGDSAGSASYVGPCDADVSAASNGICGGTTCSAPATRLGDSCTVNADCNANENTVSVWVVGVYDADVSAADAGGFNTAVSTSAGAVPFQNPTWLDVNENGIRDEVSGVEDTITPLTRVFACRENQDVFVQFDVALMRPAQQGFFDIAVNFNNIFCSAKFDCAYETQAEASSGACLGTGFCDTANDYYAKDYPTVNTDNSCGADTDCYLRTDINLLHNATGRSKTMVLGFACTAGADSNSLDNKTTELYLDDLAFTCGSDTFWVNTANHTGSVVNSDFVPVDGNLCTAGFTTCAAINSTADFSGPASAVAATYLYQVAVYSGKEQLTVDGTASYNKAYWNIALGVKGPASNCSLLANATADDSQNGGDNVDDGVIAAQTVYPYITFDVDFATCGAEPLMFGEPDAMVRTGYTTTTGTAFSFDHQSN
ncbi:MAG: hypothetical protein CVU56_21505 [Deltaproteobacteria bacterium HGW-Deltaproteobacteria-14]|nr:MAG: hypothetical protein CVU56_21505 [Deltaproteobacteria bacterium HGW-Deltaproteobacteria-14]